MTQASSNPVILIFLKAPREHTVKTRLARTIGSKAALKAYGALARFQLSRLPLGWPAQLHFTPADAALEVKTWVGKKWSLQPQVEGDLGDKLNHAVEEHFKENQQPVFLIGTDCPGLDSIHFQRAADELEQADIAIGPATDGGYYLLGLRQPCSALFRNIDWGSEKVLEQTINAAKEQNLKTALLSPLSDVDTEEQWQTAKKQFPDLAP